MLRCGSQDRPPAIKRLVGPVVAGFEFRRAHADRPVHHLPCVIAIPVVGDEPALRGHPRVGRRAGIRRQDMERRGRDSALHGPVDGPREDVRAVSIQAEDEAAVDHDAEIVEPADDPLVVAPEVLPFVGVLQTARREAFESDEQAAQSRRRGILDQVVPQDRVHGRRPLEDAAHPPHATEQVAREPYVAEQMVIEKVEMPAWQPADLRQRVVHALRVEAAPASEECILVAEGTVVRTPTRDHDRVGHEVSTALDQIAADRRDALERPNRRFVARRRPPGGEIVKKPRKRVFTRAEHDRVRIRDSFVRQRGDVQPPKHDVRSARPVVVRDAIGPIGIGDVDLDDHEIGVVVQVERLHVLVLQGDVEIRVEIGRQRGQAERRKQRVLDGPPGRARGFGQRGKDQLYATHASHGNDAIANDFAQ